VVTCCIGLVSIVKLYRLRKQDGPEKTCEM